MSTRLLALVAVLASSSPAQAASSPSPAASRYMQVEMIASTLAPKPGSTATIGFRMTPQPGWHGYWSNPGESGLAPAVHWVAPAGVTFGPLDHPAPTLMRSMGLVSFVHAGSHMLTARMSVGRSVRPGTPIPISATLDFAVCSESQCVPEHAVISMPLVAGSGAPGHDAAELASAIRRLPQKAPAGSFFTRKNAIVLRPPEALKLDARTLRFFPDANGYFDAGRAKLDSSSQASIEAPVTGKLPARISGVLSDGKSAYRVSFDRGAEPKPTAEAAPRNDDAQITAIPTSSAAESAGMNSVSADQPGPSIGDREAVVKVLMGLAIAAFAVFAFALARRPYR